MSLLIGVAALTPWANGGADPVIQVALFGLAGLCLALAMRARLRRPTPRPEVWIVPWPAIAALGGVLLCGLQLLPLWPTTSDATVPPVVALRTELQHPIAISSTAEQHAAELQDETHSGLPQRVPLTLDAHATRHTLACLLMATAIFLASTWLIDSPARITQAAWVVAASGAALTVFAVLAKATWNGKLYWSIPVGHPQGVFGPMVYHNQAGGVLLMTLAASIYLMVSAAGQISSRSSPAGDLLTAAPSWRRWLQPRPLLTIALVSLNASGLLLTLSRGALVAAIMSAMVTLLVIQPRTGWRGLALVLGIAVVGAGGSVFYFRMSDAVGRRYATLFESEQLLDNSRLAHWSDGWQAGLDHGLWGVGAGAYLHIHPLYQDEQLERVFLRAHNQYLETWVDSGLPGILLLMLAIVTTGRMIVSLSRRRRLAWRATAALGLMVLVASLTHAAVDYVMYLPATAILFAMLLGGVCGTAWQSEREAGDSTPPSGRFSRFGIGFSPRIAMLIACGLVAGCAWATFAGIRWHQEHVAVQSVPWGDDQQAVDPKRLAATIERLQQLQRSTDDYRVALTLGELQIIQFRQQALEQLAQENNLLPEDALEFWQWTAPLVLLQRAQQLSDDGEAARIETEIRREPLIARQLGAARNAFLAARRLAPAAPQPHLRLGELSFLEENLDHTATYLQRVAVLAPGSADMQFELGRRLLAAGEQQAGLAAWHRSLQLDPRHWPAIYEVVGSRLTAAQIDRWVLPDDPELLTLVAARQYTEPEQREAREHLLRRADAILDQPTDDPQQLARHRRLQAEVQLLREDVEGAIERFGQALRYAPADHEMRARRAALLLQVGRWEEAQREAQYAARLQPRNYQYRKLLEAIAEGAGL
ncbi:O-antigen ligase family protein [Roseimaritima ulvae]|uniref:O-antigen ligase family protein n=1 Tax=Roseimaritima ulvae TaxID=980254 RepID=UPI001AEF5FFD|nr:O-antigen ligase family protein [Roseimaritima ulvae]